MCLGINPIKVDGFAALFGIPEDQFSHNEAQIFKCLPGVPCGGKLTNPEGWLMAIDWEPDGYFDLYRDCLWELEAPLDYVVAVIVFDVFIDLQVDPNCEYIRLMVCKGLLSVSNISILIKLRIDSNFCCFIGE